MGEDPIDLDNIADVWEGDYRGKKVFIKCLRVPPNDVPAFEKVRVQYHTRLSHMLMNAHERRSRSSKKRLRGKG